MYASTQTETVRRNYCVYLRKSIDSTGTWSAGIVDVAGADLSPNDGTTNANWADDVIPETVPYTFPSVADADLDDWGLIGAMEAGFSVTGSAGEKVVIGCTGNEVTVSEILEIAGNAMDVNSNNYITYRAWKDLDVDLLLYDKDAPDSSIGVFRVQLEAYPKVTNNERLNIELSANKESGNLDSNFKIISVT